VAHCEVVCVWPRGGSFRVTKKEAVQIVTDGLGEWDGPRLIWMKPAGWSGGRLSCQVGARLAVAVQRNEAWAVAMLRDVRRSKT